MVKKFKNKLVINYSSNQILVWYNFLLLFSFTCSNINKIFSRRIFSYLIVLHILSKCGYLHIKKFN